MPEYSEADNPYLINPLSIRVIQKLAKILYPKTPYKFGCILPLNIVQIFFLGGVGSKMRGRSPPKVSKWPKTLPGENFFALFHATTKSEFYS